jgi:hypothetical protein
MLTPCLAGDFNYPLDIACVPFMSILWALEVALKGSVLVAGRWTELTRWGRVGLRVYFFSWCRANLIAAGARLWSRWRAKGR